MSSTERTPEDGPVAVVTGAPGGIGSAVVAAFEAAGHRVLRGAIVDGLRCNVVCPGLIETPMSARAQADPRSASGCACCSR